ncbi:glycosyltransferase family 2 protein [Haloferula sargassicola]|uniref:glycosyltransferase family 2 protein n=1 Tax=Haloferula sargassicola TaxID=490096 RepID=UPI00336556F3
MAAAYRAGEMERLRVDGRFLRRGSERAFLRMVTYGPFPGGWPPDLGGDFQRIRAAGFEAIRLYSWPETELLDAAAGAGLWVFAAPEWPQAVDFRDGEALATARRSLAGGLAAHGRHPALAGVFVANEIPADLVRWMGPEWTRRRIEALIDFGRERAPDLIWAYANYPTTEYLEPGNADLTAMNVFLEDPRAFRRYLRRLHHIAGDRPLVISEFGLDAQRHGPAAQAELLAAAARIAREEGVAGFTVYAWSDRWFNAGEEIADWSFGLIDREGREKPALAAVRDVFGETPAAPEMPAFSVIVCTRNGGDRLLACLRSLGKLHGPKPEIIVVDDGSSDGSADRVETEFPAVKLIRQEPSGLSAARNAGAAAAGGGLLAFTDDDCEADADWLVELSRCFAEGWDAAGGPNLPPPPAGPVEAAIASAPGAASHVMLDDREAEHVPGCNLAVRRTSYFEVGGFDPRFHTAGDDVDFCWRLRDAGLRIGFAPNAFVWHHRRPCAVGYLRQQLGYGRAEAVLMAKFPRRFSPAGDARWQGVIYTGSPVRATGAAIIYHGPMGLAGYQGVIARMQPLRELDARHARPWTRALLACLGWLAPRLRAKARTGKFIGPISPRPAAIPAADAELSTWDARPREVILRDWLADGWRAAESGDFWDLEKSGTRVLLACERHDHGSTRLLIRVWGNVRTAQEMIGAEATPSSAAADGPSLPR